MSLCKSLVPLLILTTGLGCGGHVILQAPSATAPRKERLKAYKGLRPAVQTEWHAYRGDVHLGRSDVKDLTLANGQRVFWPEDFVPVVGKDSIAGRAALESASALDMTKLFIGIGGVGFGIAFAAAVNDSGAGMGVGAASLIVMAVGYFFFRKYNRSRIRAFDAYESSLLQHLDLCFTGSPVENCKRFGKRDE